MTISEGRLLADCRDEGIADLFRNRSSFELDTQGGPSRVEGIIDLAPEEQSGAGSFGPCVTWFRPRV
jgi:hypothetical protein